MSQQIFSGQPSYNFFDKSFDDPSDALFQLLNDLNEDVICEQQNEEQEGGNSILLPEVQLRDPRNQQIVKQTFYNCTKPKKWVIFQSPCESNLTKSIQQICLRVLTAFSSNETPNEEDLILWNQTLSTYQTEQQQFHRYVKEYVQLNVNLIYESMQQLVVIYKTRYKQKIDKIWPQLPDVKYVTHLGLPHLRLCKSLNDRTAKIKELQQLERFGDVMLWGNQKYKPINKYTPIFHRLAYYVQRSNDSLYEDAKKKFNTPIEGHTFILPLESLLFLLTSGDSLDLPTEMLLEISEEADWKYVNFHLPLPSRICGWHTNSEIVECGIQTYESLTEPNNKWLFVMNKCGNLQNDYIAPEIDGKAGAVPYKLRKIDDETNRLENQPMTNLSKSNYAFVSWQLETSDSSAEEEVHHIFTKLKIPACLENDVNGKDDKTLGCRLIKVEHKTQFGCEVLTKYELLKAWLQLTLLQSNIGICTRVDLNDFRLVIEQNLTLEYLEDQLHKLYHVDMPHLLSNLHVFLKLLLQVNIGQYLLRFKANYPDNFLLCAPSENDSANSVHLKSFLLNNVPSEFSFLMQADYLPIAHDICGPMHLKNKCLPCAFPAKLFTQPKKNQQKPHEYVPKFTKERNRILNRVQKRRDAIKKLKKRNRVRRKRKVESKNVEKLIEEDPIMIL